jgi:CO/xanthine dehydrogenase FAD-binding subunit
MGWRALPWVEKDSIATRGSVCSSWRALAAAARAMSAVSPSSDAHASSELRTRLVGVLVERALTSACAKGSAYKGR